MGKKEKIRKRLELNRRSKRLNPIKRISAKKRRKEYFQKYKEIMDKELKESEMKGPILEFD